MNITAQVRRTVCNFLNVAEAARQLAIPVQSLYYGIRVGRVGRPDVQIGRRRYYHADNLAAVAEQFAKEEKTLDA